MAIPAVSGVLASVSQRGTKREWCACVIWPQGFLLYDLYLMGADKMVIMSRQTRSAYGCGSK